MNFKFYLLFKYEMIFIFHFSTRLSITIFQKKKIVEIWYIMTRYKSYWSSCTYGRPLFDELIRLYDGPAYVWLWWKC